jgi:hypothetical protein
MTGKIGTIIAALCAKIARRKPSASRVVNEAAAFRRQMEIAARVSEKRRVVLKALAR